MRRPNILLLMADQLRSDWLGCHGNPSVRTPNIDGIAGKGVSFSRAVCNSTVCAPSRASLASGLYPHRTGVMTNQENYPNDLPTYFQLLRREGYRVGMVGKTDLHKPVHYYGEAGDIPFLYHLGFTDPHETEGKINAAQFSRYEFDRRAVEKTPVGPYQRYLEERGCLDRFVEDYRYRADKAPVWYASESVLDFPDYHDSYIGDRACDFLTRVSADFPWHYFVSFVGPHDPWDAPESALLPYRETRFPEAVLDTMESKPGWVRARQKKQSGGSDDGKVREVRRQYSGMVSLIDYWIGQMLDILERRGLLDNTVVIITSDHGEMLGDHGLYLKNVMYEAALRVPLMVWDPRQAPSGKKNRALVELVDLFPTILDFASVGYDSSRIDGKSLLPLLREGEGEHRKVQYCELSNTRMVFDGRYKYIENKNDRDELYDLEHDPFELVNTIEENEEAAGQVYQKMLVRNVTDILGGL
ncbi:MAG TPA: sulfatase-like hydrolase/transferase [Spirochaetia bacterium]|nr:sulfatase-like hydrolase/transferase [Spirochaetia bacterium]